jgi:hypothetical protein
VAALHEANQASWQISTDQPQPLVIGLFIRDVSGMPSRNSLLPLASPDVPRAGDQAPDAAGPQWDHWWNKALREEHHRPHPFREAIGDRTRTHTHIKHERTNTNSAFYPFRGGKTHFPDRPGGA